MRPIKPLPSVRVLGAAALTYSCTTHAAPGGAHSDNARRSVWLQIRPTRSDRARDRAKTRDWNGWTREGTGKMGPRPAAASDPYQYIHVGRALPLPSP